MEEYPANSSSAPSPASTTLIFFADSLARNRFGTAADQGRVEVLDDLDGVVERLADGLRAVISSATSPRSSRARAT
ncbi:MAG: hypothetical protein WKH47_10985 [Actinomycetes bacterium]